MKLKQILSALVCVAFLAGGVSCSKFSDFEKQLDELESKVVAIETQISDLNKNVAALKYLTEGAVITEISEVPTGYELTLSDGKKLTVNHGAKGADGTNGTNGTNGTTPTISINEQGYWVINGEVQTVNAYGQNGVTPKFSVDADGYWVVSYDNGVSNERVKDADGNPVKAKVEIVTGPSVEADTFFSSVTVNGNLFVLTLRDGTVVNVPIVKGFSFVIKKDGALVEGVQEILEGTTVLYDVEQTGVASAAIVACPAGFDVELTETTLSVTALPATKATASLSKDIAILAVSEKGLSVMSKIQVESTQPQPEATFANVTHECYSFNSVKLNATVANGDRVNCIIKPASEAAATADELKAKEAVTATEGVAALTKNDLTPATEYVAYFVASDGTKYSDVQTFEFSTRAIDENNLYEKYAVGQTITVAGLEISKTSYPEALYICRGTTTKGAGKAGLVFVEQSSEISANFDAGITNLIVIGTNPAVRSNVNRSGVSYLTGTAETNDTFILANINYTSGADVFQFNGVLENVVLDNCQFSVADTKALFKSTSAANKFENLIVSNSDLGFTGTAYFGNMGGTQVSKVELRNNVFYGTSVMTAFYLYKGTGKIATVELHNNTFYQTTIGNTASNDDAMFLASGGVATFNASRNYIANCTGEYTTNRYMARPAPTAGTVSADNYYVKQSATVYFCNGTKPAWANHPAAKGAPTGMADNWDPTNGKFLLKGYILDGQTIGATR